MDQWQERVEAEIRQLIDQVVEETNQMWQSGLVDPSWAIDRVTDDFYGAQYAPWYENGLWTANAAEWREGNAEAARRSVGKSFRWSVDQLVVLPRTTDEAAVSYRISHWSEPDRPPTQALFLETWIRQDGAWTLHRHLAEKARPPKEA